MQACAKTAKIGGLISNIFTVQSVKFYYRNAVNLMFDKKVSEVCQNIVQ